MRTYQTLILRLLIEPDSADDEAELRGSLQPINGHEVISFKSGAALLALLHRLLQEVNQPGLAPQDTQLFDARDKAV